MAVAKKKPLLALTALLSESEATEQAVELALDDAPAYLKKHRRALAERAITAPKPNLPWIALIDGLAAEKRLSELDHRTDAEDAAAQLARLVTLPKKRGRFDWVADADELSTERFLHLTAKQLRAEQRSLVVLDMRSDAYPVVVVATKDAAKVVKLARAAGFSAERVEPRDIPVVRDEVETEDDEDVPVWRHFIRRSDVWAIRQGATVIDTATSVLGGRDEMRSEVIGEGKTTAEAKRRIAEKLAAGFVQLSLDEYRRRYQEAANKKR